MDSWIQLLIYSIVSLGFVTSLQSFYVTGRPRKQFELPFQQRIESCVLKRSVKIYCMAPSFVFIDSRYISLKGFTSVVKDALTLMKCESIFQTKHM